MSASEARTDAWTYVPPGAGASYWVNGGEQATIKVGSEETQGAYAVVELTIAPQEGPPPHIHHAMEESLYVLDGHMEFVTDGTCITAARGSMVRIQRGALRTYRNVGTGPATVLALFLPGSFEGFLREVGRPERESLQGKEVQPDVAAFVATAAKYGCEILPPTGAVEEG